VDLATGVDTLMEFDPANEDESELRFSPDGTLGAILAADAEGAYVQLVDLVGSAPPRRVGPSLVGNEPKTFGFSPDGTQVIYAIDNDEPLFIDVATGQVTTGPTKWNIYAGWQRLAP
jgi:DNA-binding beta-propeller fold protein YncE